MTDINITLILGAAFVALASPGPATLAIAGTSMSTGRKHGLVLATGISTGSLIWSLTAALGMSTIMQANAWLFEAIRYIGAAYLLLLAFKSAKSAFRKSSNDEADALESVKPSLIGTYFKGLGIHLTNPKAVLFFGSLYALGIPHGASTSDLLRVVFILGCQSALIFHFYAVLFASRPMVSGYKKLRRGLEALFSAMFGIAAVKVLTTSSG